MADLEGTEGFDALNHWIETSDRPASAKLAFGLLWVLRRLDFWQRAYGVSKQHP